MDDHQFARLISEGNYSWKGYRKVRNGAKKRITRHMQELGCRNMDEYLERLKTDEEARAGCGLSMTVSISRFFRDLKLWDILEKQILPELLFKDSRAVKVWSAGSACGEEIYSFRILWERFKPDKPGLPDPYIIATDINPEYLERAKRGIYTEGALREIKKENRPDYFDETEDGHYVLKNKFKNGITWQIHDLLKDPPPADGFDIVFLRNNLLTYYEESVIRKPLGSIIDSISPSGFLIKGAKENIPGEFLKQLYDYERYVYQKL